MEVNKNEKTTQQQPLGHIKSSPMREMYSSECCLRQPDKGTSKWLNDVTQKFLKEQEKKSNPSWWQEIGKKDKQIRAEINEMSTKWHEEPINPRAVFFFFRR